MANVSRHETKPSTRIRVSLSKEEVGIAIVDYLGKQGLETPPSYARRFITPPRENDVYEASYTFSWDE